MPYPLAMRQIILPQAFRLSLPPLGNQFIIGLKDSSLVAYVGMSNYGVQVYQLQQVISNN